MEVVGNRLIVVVLVVLLVGSGACGDGSFTAADEVANSTAGDDPTGRWELESGEVIGIEIPPGLPLDIGHDGTLRGRATCNDFGTDDGEMVASAAGCTARGEETERELERARLRFERGDDRLVYRLVGPSAQPSPPPENRLAGRSASELVEVLAEPSARVDRKEALPPEERPPVPFTAIAALPAVDGRARYFAAENADGSLCLIVSLDGSASYSCTEQLDAWWRTRSAEIEGADGYVRGVLVPDAFLSVEPSLDEFGVVAGNVAVIGDHVGSGPIIVTNERGEEFRIEVSGDAPVTAGSAGGG